jgi:hypothetical protein
MSWSSTEVPAKIIMPSAFLVLNTLIGVTIVNLPVPVTLAGELGNFTSPAVPSETNTVIG